MHDGNMPVTATLLSTPASSILAPPIFSLPPEGLIAKAKIHRLDLEPIKYKLIKEQNWTLEKADAVEKLYKTYLLLFALDPQGEHVPTHDIDEMWHAHILDTQKYMEDCENIFGHYLHHYPYLGLLGEEDKVQAGDKFTATRRFFIALSGLDPLGLDAADCGGGCGSGCGGGGDSGGGGGDSGGGSDHGHNDGGHVPPIISSCSSYEPGRPLKDSWDKKDRKPSNSNTPKPDQKRKSIWKRIIGLSGTHTPDAWLRSVTPKHMRKRGRPTRADLLKLAQTHIPEGATRH